MCVHEYCFEKKKKKKIQEIQIFITLIFCVIVSIACSNQLIKKHHLLNTVCFVSSLKVKLNYFDMSVFVHIYSCIYFCMYICVCVYACVQISFTLKQSHPSLLINNISNTNN